MSERKNGCWNVPTQDGYWVKVRQYAADDPHCRGPFDWVDHYIENTMSRNCRNDFRPVDPWCAGCERE